MPRSAQLLWGGVFAALFVVLAVFGACGLIAAIQTNTERDEVLRFSGEYGALILVLGTAAIRLFRGARTPGASVLPVWAFWIVSAVFLAVAAIVYFGDVRRSGDPRSSLPPFAGAAINFSIIALVVSGLSAASAVNALRRRRSPHPPPVARKGL